MNPLTFRPFQAGDETAFRELNEAWITRHFSIESKDREVLGDPVGHILSPGGEIVMALAGESTIGCCALVPLAEGSFEVGKMAIAEEWRGRGVGRKLLDCVIARGRDMGAKRLYLETSTLLPAAIHLYESAGFARLAPERVRRSPYARSNVYMELLL